MKLSEKVYVCDNILDVSHLLAENFVQMAKETVLATGGFYVALSGGTTPKLFYSLLASKPYVTKIPWESVYIFQTDERFVPFSHNDNNFIMLKNMLIDKVRLFDSHVFRMQTEKITPFIASRSYEKVLKNTLPRNENGMPRFDCVLLGVGTDGHIASLFSDTEALNKSESLVVDVYVEFLQAWRISLTLSVLNRTKNIMFLASGNHKADIIKACLNINDSKTYPVQILQPEGSVNWYLDKEAASFLK